MAARIHAASRTFSQTPEELFDVIADPAQHVRWLPPSDTARFEIRHESGPRGQVGGVYHLAQLLEGRWSSTRTTMEITVSDRPRRVQFTSAGGSSTTFEFEPRPEGTLVTCSRASPARGFARALGGLTRGDTVRESIATDLDRIAKALEPPGA